MKSHIERIAPIDVFRNGAAKLTHYHRGEWAVEGQILHDGELLIGRRFDTRALAVQWLELD